MIRNSHTTHNNPSYKWKQMVKNRAMKSHIISIDMLCHIIALSLSGTFRPISTCTIHYKQSSCFFNYCMNTVHMQWVNPVWERRHPLGAFISRNVLMDIFFSRIDIPHPVWCLGFLLDLFWVNASYWWDPTVHNRYRIPTCHQYHPHDLQALWVACTLNQI